LRSTYKHTDPAGRWGVLFAAEKAAAQHASAHWLRHNYGMRAAEAGVPADILQENFRHADPRTSSLYYRAQLERRQRAMEAAFAPET